MPNRYNRDELILHALDMAQVPNLKIHDAPNNVVQNHAYAILWLQDIIDFWYHIVPFSSGVTSVVLNITANQQSISVPNDFILDVRNGYIIQRTTAANSRFRLRRLPLQKWISIDLESQAQNSMSQYPIYYMIQGRAIKITPTPLVNYNAWLWYYFLPPILQSNDVPAFINDYVLVEYLRIRALEWCGQYESGTAQKFCDKIVASMKANGLMNEPENDEIPIERYSTSQRHTYDWMGVR